MAHKKLHEVLPREQAGVRSGKAYDFQYHQAARACLQLLDDSGAVHVFCEWHDDYVIEAQSSTATIYGFFQVKTRGIAKGPWPLREVFGLGRKKKKGPAGADGGAIVPRLLEHFSNFGQLCDEIVLVTNAGLNDEFQSFVAAIKAATDAPSLASPHREFVEECVAAYRKIGGTFASLTFDVLFGFLKKLRVEPEVAHFDRSEDDLHTVLGKRIRELSEIDLTVSQTVRIGKELVDLVRGRSHEVLDALTHEDDLRAKKAISATDVLKVLALSPDAYRVLRASGKDTLLSLSRLHRLCQKSGVPQDLIEHICKYKTEWDTWYLQERHNLEDLDYTSLRSRCNSLLKAHSEGALPMDKLAIEARTLVSEFNPKLAGVQLTPELIVGFVFSIAAENAQ